MQNDELSQYLESLEREDRYRVVETLKSSPFETTEKVMLVDGDGSEKGPFIRKRIKREAGMGTAYARIFEAQHEGAVFTYLPRVKECYQRDDELVAVTEYVPGMTLLDLVYEQDPSIMLAAWLFPLLCDAASELHEKFDPPIIHRDLKPSNIIVSQDRLAIIDFGIARNFDEVASSDTTQFGTRAYAPPEQFGYGQTDERSDVYALGMLLYFLLTETTPSPKTVQKRFKDAEVPEEVRKVIEKATAFDPASRYASARELKSAFASALLHAGPAKRQEMPSPAVQAGQAVAAAAIPAQAAYPSPSGPAYPSPSGPAYPSPSDPAYPAQAPNAPQGQPAQKPRFELLGKVWNVLVILVVLMLLRADIQVLLDPPPSLDGDHPLRIGVMYTLIMPVILVAAGYQLLDKRRLRQRVPFFGRAKVWQELLGLVGIVFASAIILGIVDIIIDIVG